jgi:hypothetical protein
MYTIMQLNASRAEQEEDVKHKLKELYYSLQPGEIIREAFGGKDEPADKKNFLQSALTMGRSFFINKVFNKKHSVKGFLLSNAIEKAADLAIGGKAKLILKGVRALGRFFKK